MTALFTGARFREFGGSTDGNERAWTAAFLDKVRQVSEGGPCTP